MQLLVIELRLLHVVPSPQQGLVSSREGSFFHHAETTTAEGVVGIGRSGVCLLGIVILVVDGTVGLRVVAQVEVRGSLVHLAVIFIAIGWEYQGNGSQGA
jgi:nitrate/nitrite transporter NarK